MKKIEEAINQFNHKDLQSTLKKDYLVALKNPEFKKLVCRLKIKEDLALKYTSKLETTTDELQNCQTCKSLHVCKNKVIGFVYYPSVTPKGLDFNYVACKYQKKLLKEVENIKSEFFQMPFEIRQAKISNIDMNDGKRAPIIKWLVNFHKAYEKDQKPKGLYLHGSFGSGKSYIISAFLNDLSKEHNVIIIYYPELLRSLKESFESNNFSQRVNDIKKTDILLLDDLGAETVTNWNRDEILGTILQYRMDNKLPTFFTSNLNITELEKHFIITKNSEEQIKAKRIIERIKQLTDTLELVSENRRK